jgi:hypothetical protein
VDLSIRRFVYPESQEDKETNLLIYVLLYSVVKFEDTSTV